MLAIAALSIGCTEGGPSPLGPIDGVGPLGIPLTYDGQIWAGAAVVDVTPEIVETWTDLDGDYEFDGCLDDPGCGEPFDDVDGDGWFDAVWIGGFGPLRPANGVHDPISVRAVVIAVDGEYLALVAEDLVGLGHPRIWAARDALAASGFDPDRLIASASHGHQGPDTMGLWGDPLAGVPGFDEAYQERITDAIEASVRAAAAAMVPVDLDVGRVRMRDRGPWFNGPVFGGKNPTARMHGMIDDHRDPILVSDQLLVLQGTSEGGTVFTLTNWSGHPEVRGSNNDLISADWPGVTREVLEATYGGIALHVPESLGGMQSALGGDLPLVDPDGGHVYAVCDANAVADPADPDCFGKDAGTDRIDADGDRVVVWAEKNSWPFVTSHGWHIAEAAIDALNQGERVTEGPVRAARQPFVLPITNIAYNVLGPDGLFDIGVEDAITDRQVCPEASQPGVLGCFELNVFRAQIGPVGFLTVPGELLPEIAWGFPDDDPRWAAEAADPAARGEGAAFFPQHDPDCLAEISTYAECRDALTRGDCDCLSIHAWPYAISATDRPPLLDHLDTEYRAIIGMADSYFSYIIPEPDFNTAASLFTDDGDHYEDTVSAARVFGDRVLEAHEALAERE